MPNGSHGKQFEKDLAQSLRRAGHWAERFRDNTWNNMQGSSQSPPDMIAMIGRSAALMELKAITTGKDGKGQPRDLLRGAISTKRCEGHQLERLLDFEKHHGKAFVVVMFYTPRAQRRCAVSIPVMYWVNTPALFERGTVRLADLRRDLEPNYHMKWVGRRAGVGPYQVVRELGPTPEQDVTIHDD